jgi:hypothetical protein
MAKPIINEYFKDCVSGQSVLYTYDNQHLIMHVVYGLTKTGLLKFGYTIEYMPYSILFYYLKNSKVYVAVSKDVFPKENIIWSHRYAKYIYSANTSMFSIVDTTKYVNREAYLSTVFDYSAETTIKTQSQLALRKDNEFAEKTKSLIPHTIGLEFETSNGTIPFDECLRAGLIPLRDGSISGIEYASIVLSPKNDGFEKLMNITNLLKQYTTHNKECALHIHFGNIPIRLNYLYAVNSICKTLENEIMSFLPLKALSTAEYKESGKDYCKRLNKYSCIDQFYIDIVGVPYFGSLTQPHVCDLSGTQKWKCKSRYRWVNFLNAIAYNKNKTIEFRCLAPTTSFNKIVGWVFVFSAILQYAEKLTKNLSDCEEAIIPQINLQNIIQLVYPQGICDKINMFLNDLKSLRAQQEVVEDYCGQETAYDDCYFSNSIL